MARVGSSTRPSTRPRTANGLRFSWPSAIRASARAASSRSCGRGSKRAAGVSCAAERSKRNAGDRWAHGSTRCVTLRSTRSASGCTASWRRCCRAHSKQPTRRAATTAPGSAMRSPCVSGRSSRRARSRSCSTTCCGSTRLRWVCSTSRRARECERVLFACAARAGELGDNSPALRMVRAWTRERRSREIRIAPLDREATERLARSVCSEVDAMRVFSESEGNPFFALEIARALAEIEGVRGELAGDIARHAEGGGDAELCARACVGAGKHCLRLFAYEEAAAAIDLGCRHVARLPREARIRLHTRLLKLLEHPALRRVATRRSAEIARLCGEASEAGMASEPSPGLHLLGLVHLAGGDFQSARKNAVRALAALLQRGQNDVSGLVEPARCRAIL